MINERGGFDSAMASRNLLSGMHRIGRDFNNRAFGGTNRDRCSHNDRIYLSNLSGQCTILQKAYGLTWAGLLVPAACHGLVVVPTTTTTPSRASSSPCTTTLTLSHPVRDHRLACQGRATEPAVRAVDRKFRLVTPHLPSLHGQEKQATF